MSALFKTLLAGALAWLAVPEVAQAAGNTIAAPGTDGGNSAWTIYAFGNAQAVSDALRAVGNFTASGTFQSIVGMIAVLGVLGVGLSSGFSTAVGKKFMSYVVAVYLTCYVMFGVGNDGPLVVNVEIIDSVDMTWKAPITIPAVVGIPASLISSAGQAITRQIEASFPIPEALRMSNGAPFNLAASMLNDMSTAQINDPHLAGSMSYYVQDCFIPAVVKGDKNLDTLFTSTQFINDLLVPYKGIMVSSLVVKDNIGVNQVVTCDAAHKHITQYMTDTGADAASFLNKATAWHSTPALNVVNAAADVVAQWSSNNGITDGGGMVKQAAMLNVFRSATNSASVSTGNSDFLTGLALEQAERAQKTSWLVSAQIFNRTMGYIFAVLQVFVYAITPLMLAASLIPGLGMALLKNFLQILLWLAIWQPMLAIVNFVILSMQQSELGGALNSTGGAGGFTLANQAVVSEKATNLQAAATFIGASVPMLAWALVKGSVDFSRILGSAAGESFAQGASNTMTTGNYSLNSASMDSFSANKHSLSSQSAFGQHSVGSGMETQKMEMGGAGPVTTGGVPTAATGSAGSTVTERGADVGAGGTVKAAVTTQGATHSSGGTIATNLTDQKTAGSTLASADTANLAAGGSVRVTPPSSTKPGEVAQPGTIAGANVGANAEARNTTNMDNRSPTNPANPWSKYLPQAKGELSASATGAQVGTETDATARQIGSGKSNVAQDSLIATHANMASDTAQTSNQSQHTKEGAYSQGRNVSAPLSLMERNQLQQASYGNWGMHGGSDTRGWRDDAPNEMDKAVANAQSNVPVAAQAQIDQSKKNIGEAEAERLEKESKAKREADKAKERQAEIEQNAAAAGSLINPDREASEVVLSQGAEFNTLMNDGAKMVDPKTGGGTPEDKNGTPVAGAAAGEATPPPGVPTGGGMNIPTKSV